MDESKDDPVLLPYEITLLSNNITVILAKIDVLLPYEITLLSNSILGYFGFDLVLLPYEITLLSNGYFNDHRLFWFYYLMKLHYSQTNEWYL